MADLSAGSAARGRGFLTGRAPAQLRNRPGRLHCCACGEVGGTPSPSPSPQSKTDGLSWLQPGCRRTLRRVAWRSAYAWRDAE